MTIVYVYCGHTVQLTCYLKGYTMRTHNNDSTHDTTTCDCEQCRRDADGAWHTRDDGGYGGGC
jgi:hypothetical protein